MCVAVLFYDVSGKWETFFFCVLFFSETIFFCFEEFGYFYLFSFSRKILFISFLILFFYSGMKNRVVESRTPVRRIWYTSFIYTATNKTGGRHLHMGCGPWSNISSETDERGRRWRSQKKTIFIIFLQEGKKNPNISFWVCDCDAEDRTCEAEDAVKQFWRALDVVVSCC